MRPGSDPTDRHEVAPRVASWALGCLGLCLGLGANACWSFELPCSAAGSCPSGYVCDAPVQVCRVDSTALPLGDSGDAAVSPPDSGPSSLSDAAQALASCGAVGRACCTGADACAASLVCDPNTLLCRRCAAFRALDALDGQPLTRVSALSGDGLVAVGSSSDSSDTPARTAVQWSTSSAGVRALGSRLGATGLIATEALATSQDGSIAVGWGNTFSVSTPLALRWRPRLAQLAEGRAEGSSADGAVVVGSVSGSDAFRWSLETGLERLPKMKKDGLDASYLLARAVSADGQVVVGEGENTEGPRRAFRWTRAGGSTGLGALPGGRDSFASSSNRDGSVVVGASSSSDGWWVFRWAVNEPLRALAPTEPDAAVPRTNAPGTLVVGASGGAAFLWDVETGEARSPNTWLEGVVPSGWRLESATGISDDGQVIVGNGTSPDGVQRAWSAFLGPLCAPTRGLPGKGASLDAGLDPAEAEASAIADAPQEMQNP